MSNVEAIAAMTNRALDAILARGLSSLDVNFVALTTAAADVEAHEGGTLSAQDWDTLINDYSATGRVIV